MAINFDLSKVVYQPFTYDELIKPIQAYNEEYEKVLTGLEQIDALSSEYKDAIMQDSNSPEAQAYQQYEDRFNNAVDTLTGNQSGQGLWGFNRASLMGMKRNYNTQIAPIVKAAKTQEELQKSARIAKASGLIVGKMPTLHEIRTNPDAGFISLDPEKMYNAGKNAAAALGASVSDVDVKDFTDWFVTVTTTSGLGINEAYRQLDTSGSPLYKMLGNALKQFGVDDNTFSVENVQRAMDAFRNGAAVGAAQVKNVQLQNNPNSPDAKQNRELVYWNTKNAKQSYEQALNGGETSGSAGLQQTLSGYQLLDSTGNNILSLVANGHARVGDKKALKNLYIQLSGNSAEAQQARQSMGFSAELGKDGSLTAVTSNTTLYRIHKDGSITYSMKKWDANRHRWYWERVDKQTYMGTMKWKAAKAAGKVNVQSSTVNKNGQITDWAQDTMKAAQNGSGAGNKGYMYTRFRTDFWYDPTLPTHAFFGENKRFGRHFHTAEGEQGNGGPGGQGWMTNATDNNNPDYKGDLNVADTKDLMTVKTFLQNVRKHNKSYANEATNWWYNRFKDYLGRDPRQSDVVYIDHHSASDDYVYLIKGQENAPFDNFNGVLSDRDLEAAKDSDSSSGGSKPAARSTGRND